MQQRQPRLGDILDDYCPRERRLTNHAVVAMVGDEVKQTRCTTCDADHEYKHAKVPRPRKKDSPAALQAQVIAGAPRRVTMEPPAPPTGEQGESPTAAEADAIAHLVAEGEAPEAGDSDGFDQVLSEDRVLSEDEDERDEPTEAEGPAHRRLIRATLPRIEGAPPAVRPAPDFTIRHPGGGRPNRFRRPQQPGQSFQGNRSPGQPGGGQPRGGMSRPGQGRPLHAQHPMRRNDGGGRKRSK